MYVIFDTETTGFRPLDVYSPYNRIVQLSAKSLDGRVFDSFVNPGIWVPPWSEMIHHISNDDIKDAPNFNTAWGNFLREFDIEQEEVVYLVGHNCLGFDKIMIEKEMGSTLPDKFVFVDTLQLFKKYHPQLGFGNYSLSKIYKHFYNKEIVNAHRADADVDALCSLFNDYILPSMSSSEGEEKAKQDGYESDKLTSVRYLGKYRAKLIRNDIRINSVTRLRKYWKEDISAFNTWLDTNVGVESPVQRRCITQQVFNQDVKTICDNYQLDTVDRYLRVKNGGEDNRCAYYRGISVINNGGYRI